jgi:hypothetical protein
MGAEDSIELSGKQLQLLDGAEKVIYAKRCDRAMLGATRIDIPLVILTTERFMAAKEKMFGGPEVQIAVPWGSVTRASGEPWNGDMMKIAITFDSSEGQVVVLDEPLVAYELETRGRSLYVEHRDRR